MEDSKVNEAGSVINPIPINMAVQTGPVDQIRLLVGDISTPPNIRILGVNLMSPITRVLFTLDPSSTGANTFSTGIEVDPNTRNIFVVDVNNNHVHKFSPNFVFIKSWGSLGAGDSEFHEPQGIAIDSNGDVYVIDRWNHRVQKFDNNGVFIKAWGSQGTGDGQFTIPWDVTFNGLNGNLLVSDIRNKNIQAFTRDGVFRGKVIFRVILEQ